MSSAAVYTASEPRCSTELLVPCTAPVAHRGHHNLGRLLAAKGTQHSSALPTPAWHTPASLVWLQYAPIAHTGVHCASRTSRVCLLAAAVLAWSRCCSHPLLAGQAHGSQAIGQGENKSCLGLPAPEKRQRYQIGESASLQELVATVSSCYLLVHALCR
jgi:hypothetical protein